MPQISDLLRYIVWLGVAGVAALLIGVVAARVLKRRLQSQKQTEAFSIEDLRQMRAEGNITQEEYEAMRAALIARMDVDSPTASFEASDPRHAGDRKVAESENGTASGPAADD